MWVAGWLVVLCACEPMVIVELDWDGDGYGVGEDCDDDDASINPDAADAWYDGVDENCDGADDFDADRDGFSAGDYGGGDCDDQNPAAYPGADERWYDGVDADCAGDSDHDADGDGEDRELNGGSDCDDTDAAVNTGATERWYDGTDQDCDGKDDDVDEDGVNHAADCDDNDGSLGASLAVHELGPEHLRVTEFYALPVDGGTCEWFEVAVSEACVRVDDGKLVVSSARGEEFDISVSAPDGALVRPDQRAVFVQGSGCAGPELADDTPSFEYSATFQLVNTAGQIILSAKEGVELTRLHYNQVTFPLATGRSTWVCEEWIDLDAYRTGAAWSGGAGDTGQTGSPGLENPPCEGEPDARDDSIELVESGLVIGEVLYASSVGDDKDEWIEAVNTTAVDLQLAGLVLYSEDSNQVEVVEDSTIVPAGGRVVFSRDGEGLSDAACLDAGSCVGVHANAIRLADEDMVALVNSTGELDRLTYGSSATEDQIGFNAPDDLTMAIDPGQDPDRCLTGDGNDSTDCWCVAEPSPGDPTTACTVSAR